MFLKTVKNLALLFIVALGIWLLRQSNHMCAPKYPYTSIRSFKEVDFSKCDQNTLVLFDMDDTLTSSVDPLPLLKTSDWQFRLQATLHHPSLLLKKYKENYWSIVLMATTRFVIEPTVIPLIAQLHSKDIVVMALTSLPSGIFGQIADLPYWRYNTIKNMGITFSQKFPDTQFPHLKNNPVLCKGILCAGKVPKGDFLTAFLRHVQWIPKQVIFFDDNARCLQSVGEACTKRQIPIALYHYQKGEDLFKTTWNKKIALQQLDILINTGKYIPAKELP
jgi:hypothetical protein